MGIHLFLAFARRNRVIVSTRLNELAELRLCPLRGEVQMLGSFLWIRPSLPQPIQNNATFSRCLTNPTN
jgi:hypothetical protein